MNEQRTTSGNVNFSVGGSVQADMLNVGNNNTQTKTISTTSSGVTQADLIALQQLFANLEQQVQAEAPSESKENALKRVEELKEAVTAEEPDLDRIEYVKRWFTKNLPTLAGAVTSVVVNPIVGKLVAVAGDAVAADFKQRFGVK